jgi:glycosyltransferase involved in cell wall biosynthesis
VDQQPVSNEPDVPLLLCVGSLIPRKGQDLLVQALAQLRDRSWRCLLAGSDARDMVFAQQLRAQIALLGLDTRVEILGECPEPLLQDLYRRADLFVLPAWYEGYGMAFTEAMAQGLPVIATTGGAIPCTVPAAAGILVPPGDIDRLAQAVARLLDDPSLRAHLAQGACVHARSLPDWAQVSAQFDAAVKELAGL